MSVIHNERTKLLATALNNVGVATVVTGLVTPGIAAVYGVNAAGEKQSWLVVGIIWFFVGMGLHVVAQWVLGRLKA